MNFLLGLLSLLSVVARITIMCVAYVVVSIAGWLEAAQEWLDRKRGLDFVDVDPDSLEEIEVEITPSDKGIQLNSTAHPGADARHGWRCSCVQCRIDRGEE